MSPKPAQLTEARIKHTKPRSDGRPLKLADGDGLYLWVMPSGRYWRLKYRFGGKEKLLALGVYPTVKTAEARKLKSDAKHLLRQGKDPSEVRREKKTAQRNGSLQSFAQWAEKWLQSQKDSLAPNTYMKATWLLLEVAKPIGNRLINQIEPAELLDLLEKITARGHYETAHRAKQRIGQVFRYAIAKRGAERDPTADLRGILPRGPTGRRAAITEPMKIGELLRAIDGYSGQPTTAAALKLGPLLFVRPGELRAAEWTEFNLDVGEWRIPANRMKMRESHIVPLSRQALSIVVSLKPLTGRGRFLFPSLRSPLRPISDGTINAALRRLGFAKDEMTGHGFRAMASTRLNELGWKPDVIERQLAHAERNKVRAAYNRATYMEERRKMMQAWADYLDGLKGGVQTLPLRRNA